MKLLIALLVFYKWPPDQKQKHSEDLRYRSVMYETRDALTRGQSKNPAPYEDNGVIYHSDRGSWLVKATEEVEMEYDWSQILVEICLYPSLE